MTDRSELYARLRALERASRPLEPGASRRRALRTAVVGSTERFLRRIDTSKAYVDTDTKGVRLLDFPITPHGMSIEDALALFEQEVVHPGGAPASGGHCAYIPGGGLYHSALGDFLAAISNKYGGVYFSAPGAVRMENQLVRWVADLAGLPERAGGHIASGGSIANLTAITTARDAHQLRSADYARSVVYLTTQAHHCIDKALRIAGMREVVKRYIPMDERWRMRTDRLADAIRDDRKAGLAPWMVIASAGTTDTGAVDPLADIADLAHDAGCWYHVDAAYGGFFLLTDHGRRVMQGIERADSVVLDPHKSLFLPYGAGIVVVRDVQSLAASNVYDAAYMQDALDSGGEYSPADLSPELTKHFRGVRMWLPLQLVGTKPFAAALEEKLLLAHYFRDEIAARGFEVGPEPDLTVVTFRWNPSGASPEEVNAMNAALVDRLRRDGRIFVSSTMLNGQYTIRFVSLQFRTHRRTVDLAVKLLSEAVT